MENGRSKHLDEIENDFERGVFLVLYDSPAQKFHRIAALSALTAKHALRGILFSWPLYLLALAVFVVPGAPKFLFLLLSVPGVYLSWIILSRGVKEDYARLVDGYMLRSGYLGRMLFHNKT